MTPYDMDAPVPLAVEPTRYVLRDSDGSVVSKPVAADEDGSVTFGPGDVFYDVPVFYNKWAGDDDEDDDL